MPCWIHAMKTKPILGSKPILARCTQSIKWPVSVRTLNKGRKMRFVTKRLFLLCLCVCRWVTLAVCAAVVKAVRCWQTRKSWVSSQLSMSWPPGRDSSTAGWAASGSSSSHHYVTEVRGSLYRLLLCWPLRWCIFSAFSPLTPLLLVVLNMFLFNVNCVQNQINLWNNICMI